MDVETAARTDPGRVRDHNEDSTLVTEVAGGTLVAVADGMGGHRAGEVASELALEAFEAAMEDARADHGTHPWPADAVANALMTAARAANQRVCERGEAETESGDADMGTTLVAAYVADGATVVNVGDSRAYHVTAKAIEQVSVDHSMVQDLVDRGVVEAAAAGSHPYRHVLSQALGGDDEVNPDVFQVALSGTLMLCSDGLSEEVPESTMHEIVTNEAGLGAAADRLVAAANERGGSDNISVVLARPARQ